MKNRLQQYAPKSISRSLPFIKILIKSSKVNRSDLLKRFPSFVVDDITEILYNIVMGNVRTTKKDVKRLKQYRKPLMHLIKLGNRKQRRKYIYKQKGGFVTGVLPIVASLLAGLIGGGTNAF